jgi:hypothetical protein
VGVKTFCNGTVTAGLEGQAGLNDIKTSAPQSRWFSSLPRRNPDQRPMHRAARTAVFAVIAASTCLLAGGARADFDQERQFYMLNRLELENAEAMLDFYEDKFAGTVKSAGDLKKRRDARRNVASCDAQKPGGIGICQRIEADYQAGIRIIATLREDVRVSLQTQRAEVERLRAEFNAAVAKYVAAVASQAAIVADEPDGEVKNPAPAPPKTVQNQPPNDRPPTQQDPKNGLPPDTARPSPEPRPLPQGQR